MKQLKTLLLTAVMAALLATGASAAETVKAFSDVPESHWAHSAIMTMVQGGLFNGTTEPVNGVGTFEPDAPMTRAQFVTVLTRLLYAQRIEPAVNPGKWWQANYETALKTGLLHDAELDGGALDLPMQRQEAAMVLVRAAQAKGFPQRLAPVEVIADYESVAESYRAYVRTCFALGILQGVDAQGSFQPEGQLTRAQAATVIYRLVDGASRRPLPEHETEFVNTAGVPVGENLTTIAGQLVETESERPERKTNKLNMAQKKLNSFLEEVYGLQFFESGIAADEETEGVLARLIRHEEDGRLGLEVFGWRGDYNTTPEQSMMLNVVLEAMVYLSGDAEVGYALWSWKDSANVNGMSNSASFGLEDLEEQTAQEEQGESTEDRGSFCITMNGVEIEMVNTDDRATQYYFGNV